MQSRRRLSLYLTLAVLGSFSANGAYAFPGQTVVPADSFIIQHVDNLSDLTQQVTMDPVVRRRLAWHFHTSGPAIVHYIQDNLVLKKTTEAHRYRVWCLARDGREYTINARLPAGTPVFVFKKTGEPVLKLACGNPMMASLPPVTKTSPSLEESPRLAAVPEAPRPAIAPALAGGGPVVMTSNDGVQVTPAPVVKVAESLPFLNGGGHGFPLAYLAGIPILAGIAHHGGDSSGTSTGTTGTTGTTDTGTTGTTGTTDTGTTGTTGTTDTGTTGTTGTTDTGTTGTIGTGSTGTTGTNTGVTPVPEPGTTATFALGFMGVALLVIGGRRRTRKARI